ncbi:MAG: hypothetical protein JSS02_07205 [Planctomycetes bacterium]|nr:hypothetical protein [Planctomycetota bacterium]
MVPLFFCLFLEFFVDLAARRQLIVKACRILDEDAALLAVTLDEFFFKGNTDEESIGVNLLPEQRLSLAEYRRILADVRARNDVQGVFLELTEIPDPDDEEDADLWPVACVAFIVTSAPLDEVSEWVEVFHPDDISEGWCVEEGVATPISDSDLKPGMRPVRVSLL